MKNTKAYVTTSRGQLHVRQCGGGSRHAVLLHILPFSSVIFESALPLLAAKGYAVTAIDLMGYGRSDPRDGHWLVADFTASVAEAISQLSIDAYVLVGGHFSGLVATEIAIQQPRRVKALVLDGAPVWAADMRAKIAAGGIGQRVPWSDDGSVVTGQWQAMLTMMKKLNPSLTVDDAAAPTLNALFRDWLVASAEPGVSKAFGAYDMEAALPRVTLPILAIAGDFDTQKASQPKILQLAPKAKGQMFAGVHPIHDVLRPARATEYADVLDQFFAAA